MSKLVTEINGWPFWFRAFNVDYRATIADGVAAAASAGNPYDCVSKLVTDVFFPCDPTAGLVQDVPGLTLWVPVAKGRIEHNRIIRYMGALGCRPAAMVELLAFGALKDLSAYRYQCLVGMGSLYLRPMARPPLGESLHQRRPLLGYVPVQEPFNFVESVPLLSARCAGTIPCAGTVYTWFQDPPPFAGKNYTWPRGVGIIDVNENHSAQYAYLGVPYGIAPRVDEAWLRTYESFERDYPMSEFLRDLEARQDHCTAR